jgi:hypothetical protein
MLVLEIIHRKLAELLAYLELLKLRKRVELKARLKKLRKLDDDYWGRYG